MPRKPPALTPRPVRDIVVDALAELLRDQPMSRARVEFAWRTAAGAALARVTTVDLQATTLSVEVPGPLWGLEVERAAPQLVARLSRLLGAGVVTSLLVRSATGGERPRPSPRRKPRTR